MIGIVLLLLSLVSVSVASKYEVPDFSSRKKLKVTGKILILPDKGSRLRPTQPRKLQEGRLYLRYKVSTKSYAFYEGKFREDALAAVYAFAVGKLSIEKAIRTKFYRKTTAGAFRDIKNVYFDSRNIYVSGLSTLYYRDGRKWENIKARSDQNCLLQLESVPSGIEVFMGGKSVGKTPIASSGLSPGFVPVILRGKDVLPVAVGIHLQPGSTLFEKVELPIEKSVKIDSLLSVKKLQLPADKKEESYEKLLAVVQSDLAVLKRLSEERAKQFEKVYSPMSEAPESIDDWSDPGYTKYKEVYQGLRKEAVAVYGQELAARVISLQDFATKLQSGLKKIWEKVVSVDLHPDAFKTRLLDTTTGKYGLKLKLSALKGSIDAFWNGVILLDSASAASLFRDLADSTGTVKVRVHYQDRAVKIPKNSRIYRRYYRYVKLELLRGNKVEELLGTYSLPNYIREQKEVQDWLDRDRLAAEQRAKQAGERLKRQEDLARQKNEMALEGIKKMYRGAVVEIPGGKFEFRGTVVELSPFSINSTEITQAHFKRIRGKTRSRFAGDSLPVHDVTWSVANKFCTEVGGKLPTEAQWEFAARAGTDSEFFWGDEKVSPVSWAVYAANSESLEKKSSEYGPHKVASSKANAWGLYDMAGNVDEWVQDYSTLFYFFVDARDPKGPAFGHFRLFKGGSWKTDAAALRPSARDYEDPRYWGPEMGFRCVFPAFQKLNVDSMKTFLARKDSVFKRNGKVKPSAKPAQKPVAKPVAKPAAKPAVKAPAKPVGKPVLEPAVKPAAKSELKPKAVVKPEPTKSAPAAKKSTPQPIEDW